MNIKPIAILAACAFFIAGCNKPQAPSATNNGDSQPPALILAEPFHGQVYKSLDGSVVLTLVSKDECEAYVKGKTLLWKYTRQGDVLRIVTTDSQVLYLRFTDQGLVDNGIVYFSPEGLAVEIQRQQIEKQRVADEKNNAVRETQIIATFSLSSDWFNSVRTPDQLVLTDASVKLYCLEGPGYLGARIAPRTNIIYFTNLRKIYDVQGNSFGLDYYKDEDEDKYTEPYINSESAAQARNVHDRVLNAFNLWRAKFPKAVNPKWTSSW